MNNTFRFFLQSISVGIFLLFFSFQAEAHGMNPITFDFDQCTGKTTITFQTYRNGAGLAFGMSECDDKLTSASFFYKNTSGDWVSFYSYGGDAPSNCTYTTGKLVVNTYPSDAAFPYQFCARGLWFSRGRTSNPCWSTDDGGNEWFVQNSLELKPQIIDPPTNVTATNGTLCDEIDLKWDTPTQSWATLAACTYPGTYLYDIYNGSTRIGRTSENKYTYQTNTKTDISFHIVTRWEPNSNPGYFLNSAESSDAVGKIKQAPDPATGVLATTDRCDGAIKIEWSWYASNPEKGFKLYRSTNNTNNFVKIADLSGSVRNYVNDANTVNYPAVKKQNYYYKVSTMNDCNLETPSENFMGYAADKPLPANLLKPTIDSVNNTINLNWNDLSDNEDRYIVEKSLDGGGAPSVIELPKDAKSFIDESVASCIKYNYKVKAINTCSQYGVSSNAETAKLSPDLSAIFNGTYKLTCSKGYFGNKVELKWAFKNTTILTNVKIYRKTYGSSESPTLINTVTPSSGIYNDETTEAGVFYQYSLVGETDCAGTMIQSPNRITPTLSDSPNIIYSEDVGFRSPTGLINGHIEFAGGNAVKDVIVSVEKSSKGNGTAAAFDGNGYLRAPAPIISNALTIESWVSISDLTVSQFILGKEGSYIMRYDALAKKVKFEVINGGTTYTAQSSNTIVENQYYHFTGVYDGVSTNVKLFLNGELVQSVAASASITQNADSLKVGGNGGTTNFKGKLDEIRVWNIAKLDADVKKDFRRILNGNETGLVVTYHADEGAGTALYDISKTINSYNGNHASFKGTGFTFSYTVPDASLLGYVAYTNATGDYTIDGVRYGGTGDNFKVTPRLGVHKFTPANKVLFIGDGSSILNSINFLDESSFKVDGIVKYSPKDTTEECNCFVEGAYILIDGSNVIKDGKPVATGSNGEFSINVPIGEHFISVEKPGHTYKTGRYPKDVSKRHDFKADVSGIVFIDTTFVKVIGKVVGGTREEAKPMIIGRSKNNIGVADIEFKTTSGCYKKLITTSQQSGDYTVYLPPLKYEITNFNQTNSSSLNSPTFFDDFFQNNKILDASNIPPVQEIIDTVFKDATKKTWDLVIGKETYQLIRSWIYRSVPEIMVYDLKNRDFTINGGDNTYIYNNPTTKLKETLTGIGPLTFGFPLFSQGKEYKVKIGAIEKYSNKTSTTVNPTIDEVPVTTGFLNINNGLATIESKKIKVDEVIDPITNLCPYSFIAGYPSTTFVEGKDNFTKVFKINYASGTNNVDWKPNGKDFEGIILGSIAESGQSFVTKGPVVPEMILRDPPGTDSYCSLEKGRTFSTETSWNLGGTQTSSLESTTAIGAKFSVGIGMAVATEIKNEATCNITQEMSVSGSGSLITNVTTTENWSTGQGLNGVSSNYIGAGGDLYIGKSMNIDFGLANCINIVKSSTCNLPGVKCNTTPFAVNSEKYYVAKRKTFAVAPGGYATSFTYTQDHIVNREIPRLKELRNQLFTDRPTMYVSKLPKTDPNFGKSNDDPVFGKAPFNSWSPTCSNCPSSEKKEFLEASDANGVSYQYIAPLQSISIKFKSNNGDSTKNNIPPSQQDSVWWYNQQIRLWENAVAMNEKEKYDAMNKSAADQNHSLSGGSSYVNTLTTDTTNTLTTEFQLSISNEAILAISAEVNGSGLSLDYGLGFSVTSGAKYSTTNTRSTTFSYTLSDSDQGDKYTIDVNKSKLGFGPIFTIRAGETSCPFEDVSTSLYYTKSDKPVIISGGTLQKEKVELNVDRLSFSKKVNIPSDGKAVFDLRIENKSVTGDDIEYAMKVLAHTNEKGAIVTIDGNMPSDQLYLVKANGLINKQLVIERGVSEYEYDSIAIVVGSACGDKKVGDTIYVSVHFLPTCSDIAIANPSNQFVVNNGNKDTLNVIVNNYDINYNGLKEIDFLYKKSAESSWVGLQSWYKNVTFPSGIGKDSMKISETQPYTLYKWSIKDLPDGNYDIRSKSKCDQATLESIILTGVIDRINPAAFGTPSPADGILDPNDDISIQFNESVDIGTISSNNFDVRGVLNGGTIDHGTSLNLDGTANYLEVVGGANLQNRDFSVEFWAKRNNLGEQAVVSQGIDAKNSLFIGFNAANEFTVRLGDAAEVATTGTSPVLNKWNHYAVSYNKAKDEVLLFVDGELKNALTTKLIVDYTGSGKLIFGKENHSNSKYFNGNVHGIRMWSKALKGTEVSSQLSRELNRSSAGLLYDWRMNEADGNVATDYIRSRNADIKSATWQLDPNGFAAQFDGVDDNIKVDASRNGIDSEMDFTLEFWFNSSQTAPATLFSNGKGDGVGPDKLYAWNIQKDANGKIHVFHNGIDFVATNEDYFDGKWHHFAMTMQRTGNLTAYIDGNIENSILANDFKEFNTARMHLGTRAYQVGVNTITDLPFTGKMDDFRVWNLTRKLEQIKRDKQFRLKGDEPGLFAYLPFEGLTSSAGILSYTATTKSLSENSVPGKDNVVTSANNGVVTISQTPLLKLPRPVSSIPITFLINNDKIIIQPTKEAKDIENVTLDITVKNIKDLHGNTMVSPKTWISYMNKNQVKWQDDLLEFTIEEGKGLSFTEEMVNTGGALKQYTISNIPSWMSVTNPTGNISPNSSSTKTFNVSTGINIGTYEEDILLTTDFGYAEKLTVRLVVKAIEPKYSFDPLKYKYSMNIIGQLKIDNVVSSNEGDKLIAYVNNEVRGIGALKYLPAYDKYEVFLNVYGNSINGETVKFNIWNAANGETYVDVTPNVVFEESKLIGIPAAPETFATTTKIKKNIPLTNGWTWVSFPVSSTKFISSNNLFSSLSPVLGNVCTSDSAYDQYSNNAWKGKLGVYSMMKSYKIKLSKNDTLRLEGSKVLPDDTPIAVYEGWNWIGFNSLKNLSVADALGNYNPKTGDILKGQFSFAYYDNLLGWMGSLATMIPTEGYMLKSSEASVFKYPNSAVYGKSSIINSSIKNNEPLVADFYPEQFSKNMSIIGSTNVCPEIIENDKLLLKVYSGNELRGVCKPQWVEAKNDYLFFMTAYSNNDQEKLTFVYTTEGDSEVKAVQEIVFTENNLLGSPKTPLLINVDESENCSDALKLAAGLNVIKDGFVSISPNPFSKVLNIDFKQETDGLIRLFDTAGKEVYVREIKKMDKIEINFNEDNKFLTTGVYFLRIDTDSTTTTYKLIKQ